MELFQYFLESQKNRPSARFHQVKSSTALDSPFGNNYLLKIIHSVCNHCFLSFADCGSRDEAAVEKSDLAWLDEADDEQRNAALPGESLDAANKVR